MGKKIHAPYLLVFACSAEMAPPCCPRYTVKPGDTAESVASSQSVSPTLLTGFNSLPEGAALTPGQSIQIPCARVLSPLATGIAAMKKTSGSTSPSPEQSG